MGEFLVNFLVLMGAAFTFIAALGLMRFPDFYCRVHAAAKAGAFGGALFVLAAGLAMEDGRGWLQVFLVIAFFYFTTPVASHLLARAAMARNVKFYRKREDAVTTTQALADPEVSAEEAPAED